MSKVCPKCKKENPSGAKFCMFCSTQLVSDEELTAEDKLQKELNEANDTISLQRIRMLTLEDQLKKYENKTIEVQSMKSPIIEDRKKYEQQIAERETLNANLKKQLEDIKNRKSKNKWAWLFFLLCAIFVGLMIKYYSTVENRDAMIYTLQDEIKQIKNEKLTDLKVDNETFNRTEQENEKLRDENEKLSYQIAQLKENKEISNGNKVEHEIPVKSTSHYRAITKAYFYDYKNGQFIQRNTYLAPNDAVSISVYVGGYGYVDAIKGYLKMSDLTKN